MTQVPYFRTPAIKVSQPLSEFVVCVLPAKILLATAYSHRLKAISMDNGSYKLEGAQRLINSERLKEVGQYIRSGEAAFPNSIILAANFREDTGEMETDEYEEDTGRPSRRWQFDPGPDGVSGHLTIPTPAKLASIIDGQHRLFGFEGLSSEDLEMQLVCAVYFDLPKSYQAYLFATINANQKPVDKSLTYELFGYSVDAEPPESWTPDKLAIFIARKLNADQSSPFHRRISIPAENELVASPSEARRAGQWMVSLAVIVDGTVKLISRNPKDDAHRMLGESSKIRQRSHLKEMKEQNAPLRSFYIATNDTVLYTVVKNFFTAASNLFWQSQSTGYITKTIGIQSLFDVLRLIAGQAISDQDVTVAYFEKRLASAKQIDFADHFFQASGTGRIRIRKCLEFALGLRSKTEYLDSRDGESYRRLVGG